MFGVDDKVDGVFYGECGHVRSRDISMMSIGFIGLWEPVSENHFLFCPLTCHLLGRRGGRSHCHLYRSGGGNIRDGMTVTVGCLNFS